MRRALPLTLILLALASGPRSPEACLTLSDSSARFTVEATLLGAQIGIVQLETAASGEGWPTENSQGNHRESFMAACRETALSVSDEWSR